MLTIEWRHSTGVQAHPLHMIDLGLIFSTVSGDSWATEPEEIPDHCRVWSQSPSFLQPKC